MYFFDTYALFEILKANPAYQRFADEPIITTSLNLAELYYGLLKQDKSKADALFSSINPDLLEITPDIAKTAMKFRYTHKKAKLSMVDCIGYALARHHNIPFLTGDQGFSKIEHVEYVK